MADLEQIKARLAAATPGPWEWDDADEPRWLMTSDEDIVGDCDVRGDGNAALIANAPADLAACVGRIETLERLAGHALSFLDEMADDHEDVDAHDLRLCIRAALGADR